MRYEIVSSPEGVTINKLDEIDYQRTTRSTFPKSAIHLKRSMPLEEILYDLIPFLTGVKVGLHVPAYEEQRQVQIVEALRDQQVMEEADVVEEDA